MSSAALPLLLIDGEPLERFCVRHRFPLERMRNRLPGEWWLFLFLTPPGPLLDSLEKLLGVRQLDAVRPFLAETDWRTDSAEWRQLSTAAGQLTPLRAALLREHPAPHWWETGQRSFDPNDPDPDIPF